MEILEAVFDGIFGVFRRFGRVFVTTAQIIIEFISSLPPLKNRHANRLLVWLFWLCVVIVIVAAANGMML